MSWFIFVGDMLVMLFMVVLVTWVFMVSADRDIDRSANIPLNDEDYGDEEPDLPGELKKAGVTPWLICPMISGVAGLF